jgi:hypothetical protein
MLPSLRSDSTESTIDFLRPAAEDGRVLRSTRLHSGALAADMSRPPWESSYSVGSAMKAVAGDSASFAEGAAQSAGEEGKVVDEGVREEHNENEEKDEGRERRGRGLDDPYTPLAKRGRTQSGEATGERSPVPDRHGLSVCKDELNRNNGL